MHIHTGKLGFLNPKGYISDLSFLWIVPLLILLAMFFATQNTEGILFPAWCASISCLLALKSARYNPLSFVSVCALVHLISYPIAATLNVISAETAIYEPFLWEATPLAMWACTLGMAGLALGTVIASYIYKTAPGKENSDIGPSPVVNGILVFTAIPIVLAKLYLGIYFHSQITGQFNMENAYRFAFLDYIIIFSYSGIYLQICRYCKTKTVFDLLWALFLITTSVLIWVPSGSRDQILRTIVIAFLAFWAYEKRTEARLRILLVSFLSIMFVAASMQFYRNTAKHQGDTTTVEKLSIIADTMSGTSMYELLFSEDSYSIYARRFADYVTTGWFIMTVPDTSPHRYFEGMQYWPVLLLPKFMRPKLPPEVLQDTAYMGYSESGYGWLNSNEGSVPTMILGDCYLRFGWAGIFIIMFFISLLLRKIDMFLTKPGLYKKIVWTMMMILGWKTLTQGTTTQYFILFTRTFVICIIAAILAAKLLGRKKYGKIISSGIRPD